MAKKKKNKSFPWVWIVIIILILASITIFLIPFPYTAKEVQITQQPYTEQESYVDQEPYYETVCETEIPESVVGGIIQGISDLITGSEPFEECYQELRYKSVTKYRTVTKYREVKTEHFVTKYATLYQKWTGQVQYYYEVFK